MSVWIETFGREPKDARVRAFPESLISALAEDKGAWRQFLRATRNERFAALTPHAVQGVGLLAVWLPAKDFGGVKELPPAALEPFAELPLPADVSRRWRGLVRREFRAIESWHDANRVVWHLRVIFAEAEGLERTGHHPGMTLKKLATVAVALRDYPEPAEDAEAFHAECVRWGLDPDEYPSMEERWLEAVQAHGGHAPYSTAIEHAGYSIAFLHRDDARGIWLGQYFDCCQHPDGAGASCAWFGHENPESGFAVAWKDGKMRSMAWVWRDCRDGRNELVLDSIECYGVEPSAEHVGAWCTFARRLAADNHCDVFIGCDSATTHAAFTAGLPIRLTDKPMISDEDEEVYSDSDTMVLASDDGWLEDIIGEEKSLALFVDPEDWDSDLSECDEDLMFALAQLDEPPIVRWPHKSWGDGDWYDDEDDDDIFREPTLADLELGPHAEKILDLLRHDANAGPTVGVVGEARHQNLDELHFFADAPPSELRTCLLLVNEAERWTEEPIFVKGAEVGEGKIVWHQCDVEENCVAYELPPDWF